MDSYPGARVIAPQRDATNVWVHLNLVYDTRDGRDLRLQIIEPSGDASLLGWGRAHAQRHGCIVFVQGSGWGEQPLGMTIPYLCRFAELGWVVAVVEYRPSSVAGFPAQVVDTKNAWRWLREHADEYSIDPERMVIAGDSSGGHTALLVHATDGVPGLDDDPAGSPLGVRAAVAIYPAVDLRALPAHEAVADLFGGRRADEVPELAAAASVPTHVAAERPLAPLLLVHGTADDVVPISQSVDHFELLRGLGHPVELVVVEDAKHGSWPALFSPELGRIADEFLRQALGDR